VKPYNATIIGGRGNYTAKGRLSPDEVTEHFSQIAMITQSVKDRQHQKILAENKFFLMRISIVCAAEEST